MQSSDQAGNGGAVRRCGVDSGGAVGRAGRPAPRSGWFADQPVISSIWAMAYWASSSGSGA